MTLWWLVSFQGESVSLPGCVPNVLQRSRNKENEEVIQVLSVLSKMMPVIGNNEYYLKHSIVLVIGISGV